MPQDRAEKCYDRADAHMHVSHDQLKESGRGKVSASMRYATARFNAWASACGFPSGEHRAIAREETLASFVHQYRLMLKANFDNDIYTFEKYLLAGHGEASHVRQWDAQKAARVGFLPRCALPPHPR